ncbi:MAG: helix-turn-helix domain-containing protein [Patescibacteria group bacterium]
MLNQINIPQTYTPEQVASILQLTKNTVYDLIGRGEIIAKKIGKVYRIPVTSVYFALTGMDYDLYLSEKEDFKNLDRVEKAIKEVRKNL